jgi:inner membrane protein involved in colicin E2 resistance
MNFRNPLFLLELFSHLDRMTGHYCRTIFIPYPHTDEIIKNRARETQQVRQSAVRTSKRNEKLAAKRGMAPAVTSPMQIEQQVQTEMNKRAVRKAQQVVKFAQTTQQQQPTTKSTTARRRPKKPAAMSATNMEQTKVIRQIKQDGKKAAHQLKLPKNAVTAVVVQQPTGKALQAARIALKEHGLAIPRGYTLQVVPASSAARAGPARAGSANANKPTPPTKNTAANNNNNNNNNGGGGGGPARRRRQPAPSQQR